MLALNVTAGAALISVAAPLTQELAQVGPALGAIGVCMIWLFNGAGRLFWGTMSDRIGRPRAFMAMFLLQAIAFALVPVTGAFWLLLVPVALIALCYGGGFGTMPAFATDVFGARNAGTIYGAMLTAWSAGAIAGPLLIAAVPYRTALPIIVCLLAIANILPVVFNAFAQRGVVRTVSFGRKRAAVRWRIARGRAAATLGLRGGPARAGLRPRIAA
jgi:OFA family oxalate/formate antiporter-like MFS transporter